MVTYYLLKRSSDIAEGPRDTLSVEVMSTAAQLYENSNSKRLRSTVCKRMTSKVKVIGIAAI